MATAIERRWPPLGDVIEVEGAAVHYLRMGSGPVMILIHGASGNVRDWSFDLMPRLAEHFDVIAFDRPGHGHSARIPQGWEPARQAAQLRAAAQRLGVERALVVGHSFGGAVALSWALDAPETVRGLGLLCAPSHTWPGTARALYDLFLTPAIGPVASWVYGRLARALPERQERAVRCIFSPNPMPEGYPTYLGVPLSLRSATVRANAEDIARLKPFLIAQTPRYGTLPMPVLQLHGTHDTIVPLSLHSERLKAALPQSRLIRLEGVGHMPHHARPYEVMAALHDLAQDAAA